MVQYGKKVQASVSVPPVSGANVSGVAPGGATAFYSWLPSTWPKITKFDATFLAALTQIFDESMLGEIAHVVDDVLKSNADLQHRGHAVAIPMFCALDAVSSYPYRGKHVAKFIKAHFPADYKPHAADIYKLYRNSMVHSWNLFEASIYPGHEKITKAKNGIVSFGLLNFFDALKEGVNDFLAKLPANASMQSNTLRRYSELRRTAKP